MEDSALAVIVDVPWWAACRADKHLDLREGGTIMRSLYRTTPSLEERWLLCWWYCLMGGGTRSEESGKPFSTVERSKTRSGLEAVAFWTSVQVID